MKRSYIIEKIKDVIRPMQYRGCDLKLTQFSEKVLEELESLGISPPAIPEKKSSDIVIREGFHRWKSEVK